MSNESRIEAVSLPRIEVTREEDFTGWYKEVLIKGDMVDYHDLPGCFILKPTAYFIWEEIRRWFDIQMRRLGVKNCSFPLFVSQDTIQKNKGHWDDKLSKLPWITQIGDVPLERKIAVDATPEIVLYPSYSKWIHSQRDLPLKLNQWHSVVRWHTKEKEIQRLLQATEFLWQEAHTAHLTEQSAYDELEEITGLYAYIFEDLLAMPVTKGWKTQRGKSAGALYTSSVEVYIPDAGYSTQGASCNGLGQNYSKVFGIAVDDPEKESGGEDSEKHLLHVWQNSWSLSSRAIGIMVMSHADDRGIILPPRVAEIQVVIIPVGLSGINRDERQKLYDEIRTLQSLLSSEGIRAESDLREGYSPGQKFNEWRLRGVPLCLDFGPEESAGHFVTAVRDIAGEDGKSSILISNLTTGVLTLLYEIHNNLYSRAESRVRSRQKLVRTWPDFVSSIVEGKICLAPHCLTEHCERELENKFALEAENDGRETKHASTTATSLKGLCVPFDQPGGIERGVTKCINPECTQAAEKWCMFGFSY